MKAQLLRDTQLGHLVRLLSGKKLFRYPDEIDTTLWRISVRRPDGSRSAEQTINTDRPDDAEIQLNGQSKESDGQDEADLQDHNLGYTIKDGKDIRLVDWYGPDDLDVREPQPCRHRPH